MLFVDEQHVFMRILTYIRDNSVIIIIPITPNIQTPPANLPKKTDVRDCQGVGILRIIPFFCPRKGYIFISKLGDFLICLLGCPVGS